MCVGCNIVSVILLQPVLTVMRKSFVLAEDDTFTKKYMEVNMSVCCLHNIKGEHIYITCRLVMCTLGIYRLDMALCVFISISVTKI